MRKIAGFTILFCTFALRLAAAPCTSAEHHQLDFWIGNWNVYDVSDEKTIAAHVRVDSILDGCVLHESYEDPSGLHGESYSIFDESQKKWHQTWVTNRGQLLQIDGSKRGDAIVFEGASDGTMYRVSWKPEGGVVRETAERSTDHGKTWTSWFDLRFKVAAPPPSSR